MDQSQAAACLGTVISAYPLRRGEQDDGVVHTQALDQAKRLYGPNVRIVRLRPFLACTIYACFSE